MPLIKFKDAENKTVQPEVLRLQDIEAEAARILAAAQEQAQAMTAAARSHAEKLKAEARKAGMEAGRAEGLKAGSEIGRKQALEQAKADFAARHAAVVKAFAAALSEFESRRRSLLSEMERDVVALAGAIAHRVVKAAVQVDPACLAMNIREALQLIVDRNSVEIRLHPTDLEQAQQFAREILSAHELETARFIGDETVGRGGAMLKMPAGQVDASIETQWVRLLDEILAGWTEHWLLKPAVPADSPAALAEQVPGFVEIFQADAVPHEEGQDTAEEVMRADATGQPDEGSVADSKSEASGT